MTGGIDESDARPERGAPSWRSYRKELIVGRNIAKLGHAATTRRSDVDFAQTALRRARRRKARAGGPVGPPKLLYRNPGQSSLDGNSSRWTRAGRSSPTTPCAYEAAMRVLTAPYQDDALRCHPGVITVAIQKSSTFRARRSAHRRNGSRGRPATSPMRTSAAGPDGQGLSRKAGGLPGRDPADGNGPASVKVARRHRRIRRRRALYTTLSTRIVRRTRDT